MTSTSKLAAGLLTGALALSLGARASAFCGFYVGGAEGDLYNHATQVVLMRDGIRTVLSMANNYQGPPRDFAMVVPVPVVLHEENVRTLSRAVFERLDQLTSPRLVEYWEQDPCPPPFKWDRNPHGRVRLASRSRSLLVTELGAGPPPPVRVEAQFVAGEYQIVILSATDSMALDRWLRQNGYRIPAGAEPSLRPYVQQGMKFFVARVDASKVRFENGQAMLSPLRFHYDAEQLHLPIRLGLINSAGSQDLIVSVLGRGQRYDVANYENVAIPTNLEVADATRGQFGAFYTRLFEDTLRRHPRAVVTEYAWQATKCDPCPGPALTLPDLVPLGADVIPSGGGDDFVITRLHLRYTKDALGDDLFFRAAPPIAGGREVLAADERLERGAVPAGTNSFQARYVIRHAWAGAIRCPNPRRGVWGSPPNLPGTTQAISAPQLGLQQAGDVSLGALLTGVTGSETVLAAAGVTPALVVAPAEEPEPVIDIDEPPPGPPPEAPRGGCAGCAAGGDGAGALGAGLAALVLAALRRVIRARR